MSSLISAKNINVIRDNKNILKDISISIGINDFVTIVGPNGAGKSTLLRCLLKLITPDSGIIDFRPGLRIGYVPQKFLPDKTIPISLEKFLILGKECTVTDFNQVIKLINIEGILSKYLYEISGGELQRVVMARALLGKPDLLILDEPAQQLDVSGQLSFYKLLEEVYSKQKISILMVSHDLHLVLASTKQVICLFHHICCSGEPNIVTKDPEFISLFGKDMAKIMAVYHHSHDHKHGDELDV